MNLTPEQNKVIVTRFNKEFIEQGKIESFKELISEEVINHTAPAGSPNGADSMLHFLKNMLRAGFPDLKVDILEQIAERDLVTSRKKITGTHTGEFMGIAASNQRVEINVIDIIRLKDGKYVDHWGMSNLPEIIAQLAAK